MPSYSVNLDRPGEDNVYVPTHEFDNDMRAGDTFEYDGAMWQVLEVATKQFDAEGEPEQTLRCVLG
jgi:hypothetical protein